MKQDTAWLTAAIRDLADLAERAESAEAALAQVSGECARWMALAEQHGTRATMTKTSEDDCLTLTFKIANWLLVESHSPYDLVDSFVRSARVEFRKALEARGI